MKQRLDDGSPVSRSVGWHSQWTGTPVAGGTDLFWTLAQKDPWYTQLDRGEFDFVMTQKPVGGLSASLELDNALTRPANPAYATDRIR